MVMMMGESGRKKEWRVYPECHSYVISKCGMIVSLLREKPITLRPRPNNSGYMEVNLTLSEGSKMRTVHGIILETFVGRRPLGMQCNHIDGDKKNNKLENLEWVTPSENQKHALRNGLMKPYRKLTEGDIREIIKMISTGLHTQGQVAKHFKVKQSTISCIVRANNEESIGQDVREIYEHWLSASIIKHRTINRVHRHINAALKLYGKDEIKEAINNYKEIIESSEYFFNYKWGLGTFLVRGLEKFVSENNPFDNYRRGESSPYVQESKMSERQIEWGKASQSDRIILENKWRKELKDGNDEKRISG